ncbi:MAG: hypothetical protein ABIH46_11160 [Chloroflexota bacterium]
MMNPKCPFCEDRPSMRLRSSSRMIGLLIPENHTVARMMTQSIDKARGKWYQCPICKFAALFEKNPSEP